MIQIDWTILRIYLGAFSYILGSIPFGLILAKVITGKDVRKVGSGNIGATNALRTAGKAVGALTLLLDITKGYFAVWVGIQANLAGLAFLAVMCGHLFPVWLKFRGGKGVATFFGSLLACSTPVGIIGIIAWIGFFLLTRIASLSSLLSVATTHAMIWLWRLTLPTDLWVIFIGVLLIIVKHASNIKRLLRGEETTIQKK